MKNRLIIFATCLAITTNASAQTLPTEFGTPLLEGECAKESLLCLDEEARHFIAGRLRRGIEAENEASVCIQDLVQCQHRALEKPWFENPWLYFGLGLVIGMGSIVGVSFAVR